MRADFDAIKRAVVAAVAVVAALGYGALDTGVAFRVHAISPFCRKARRRLVYGCKKHADTS